MRITTEQLQQQLERAVQPLYTVFGEETLLALEACDRIRAAARTNGYTEREVLSAEAGFRWNELRIAGSSQSLFASRKILELRIPSGKPGVEGSPALVRYVSELPPDTVTLVYLPGLDWRAQKSEWFEALERAGVVIEARSVPRKNLPHWLAGRLKAQHQHADAETLSFIGDRVEGNLMAAYQEIQKLALLFPPGKLDFDAVRDAVLDVARYDVFNLGESLLEGDPVRLSRMLDGLRAEGTAPPLVLWALAEEIRLLAKVVSNTQAGKPISVVVRELRVRGPSHQSLMQAHYARCSQAQITDALRHAAAIDRLIKGLAKGDVWDELLQLALRFAKGNTSVLVARRNYRPGDRAERHASLL
jgi:DNA polymerase-3 subunit delta